MGTLPAKIYTKDWYLSECGGFEEFLAGGMSKRLWQAFSLADLNPGQSVLDIGTGRGELVLECAKFGCQAWGIDYSKEATMIARKNLKKYGKKDFVKRVTFKVMNAKKLRFPDCFFDRVFLIDVVEHLYPEELEKVLGEVKRVIKPGGRIVIHTPNSWLIKPIYFMARLVFGWKKSKYHVNEQSFFGLARNLKPFKGETKIFFRQWKNYFFGAIANSLLPDWIKKTGRILDFIFESKPVSFFIYRTPLSLFLGAHLWAIVDLPCEAKN